MEDWAIEKEEDILKQIEELKEKRRLKKEKFKIE